MKPLCYDPNSDTNMYSCYQIELQIVVKALSLQLANMSATFISASLNAIPVNVITNPSWITDEEDINLSPVLSSSPSLGLNSWPFIPSITSSSYYRWFTLHPEQNFHGRWWFPVGSGGELGDVAVALDDDDEDDADEETNEEYINISPFRFWSSPSGRNSWPFVSSITGSSYYYRV
ncbi:hypothetical protein BDN72DRAFT_902940 [Pluteus cervinus]|uniref:Uncharacterized protein n=1 Tax=Pluteus cervinus TaxID=181527 RepID=A0ACD3ABW2_9AGAR|nr:hypothetical protein BDN72DRAFT_902940 [Pluteus cervinus]